MVKAKQKKAENFEDQPYEELLKNLASVVEELEKGEVSLEESLISYERGVTLVRHAQARIENMEQRLEELTPNGELKPFNIQNDAVLAPEKGEKL